MINKPFIYKDFKDFTNYNKKTNRVADFSYRPFTNIFKYKDLLRDLPKTRLSGKQNSFRHILKSSASMYERSDSQLLRNTDGIQSGADAFEKSRFIMTFLIILRVTKILCSFRLVLEEKADKGYLSFQN